MAVQTSCIDYTDLRKSWNEYSFSAETKVRPPGPVNDPADLDIAYEEAKGKADREAAARPDITPGEPTYAVFVRVVRHHRKAWSA